MNGFMLIHSNRNFLYHGDGYLSGEIADNPSDPDSPDGRARILGAPARVRIEVFARKSRFLIETTFSDSSGIWRVENLSREYEYFVIGFHPSGTLNAAIQDRVVPVQMVYTPTVFVWAPDYPDTEVGDYYIYVPDLPLGEYHPIPLAIPELFRLERYSIN